MKIPVWILSLLMALLVAFHIHRTMKADAAKAAENARKAYAQSVFPRFYIIQDNKMYLNGNGADPRRDRIMVGIDGKNASLIKGSDNYWAVTGIPSRPGWKVLHSQTP